MSVRSSVGVAVALLLVACLAVPGLPVGVAGATTVGSSGLSSSSVAPANTTDCTLVNATGDVAAIGWPPSFATDIADMLAKLCVDPVFVVQLEIWGGWHYFPPQTANGTTTPGYWYPRNFSEQWGDTGPPCPCNNQTTFAIQYIAGPNASHPSGNVTGSCATACVWDEYWLGLLPGTNYTGPYFQRGGIVTICTGCLSAPYRWFPWEGPFSGIFWIGVAPAVAGVATCLVLLRRRSGPPPQSPPPPGPGDLGARAPNDRGPAVPP